MQKEGSKPRYVPTGTPNVYRTETQYGTRWYVRMPKNEKKVRPYLRAETEKAAKELAARAHTLGEATPDRTYTLKKVVEMWRADKAPKLKPRTREGYERVIAQRILPEFGRMPVRNIRRAQIARWLEGMERKDGKPGRLDDGTRAFAYAVLRALMQHAMFLDALTVMPALPRGTAPQQSKEQKRRILTADEEAALLGSFGRRGWMAPIVQVALGAALRLGEVVALRWEDVDWDGNRLTVARTLGKDGIVGLPKGGKAATIQMTDRVRRTLLPLWMEAGRPAEGGIFENTIGGTRHPRDVQRAFGQAAEKAGLEGVSMHSLRHTGISRYANAHGMDLARAVEFARHSDAKVTMTYLHVVQDDQADEAGRMAI